MIADDDRIYLDTNVILDVIEKRRTESLSLLKNIKRLNVYCCTSSFALCETIDKEQEFIHIGNMCKKKCTFDELLRNRRQKELNETQRQDAINKINVFFGKFPVEVFIIEGSTWDKAIEILRDLNVSACDAVQIATAIANKCTVFVTNDGKLKDEVDKIDGLESTSARDAKF
jgi:predicted nucleic acid-binding protein